ncbi:uncharacterized protein LOC107364790 [Tetranychus urticae]|uniref:Uncharacterized protein n=1 Tax=Tetranychus urticae TaxID=32264 RepID=T1KK68_TETUR|nr:uncharacterized protein LOC107364790 [Tetranychus urticae]
MVKIKVWLTVLFQAVIILFSLEGMLAISCYKCQSINGMDSACESGSSGAGYQENCRFQPMGRQLQSAAEYCIKIVGRTDNRETILIRDCDEKPLSRTQPSYFNYQNRRINGTQYSCKSDYCNKSSNIKPGLVLPLMASLLIITGHYFKATHFSI